MATEQFRYLDAERRILDMVETGRLKPGDRLPSLREFGRLMGVSLSTVSQAYQELEAKGVVEARPRSGFYVRKGVKRLPTPTARPSGRLEASTVKRSTLIRTVLETVGREDILPLGLAHVGPELLPVKALGRIMAQVVRDEGLKAIEYETIYGNREYRRQVAGRCIDHGMRIEPEDVVATSGCMEALYIALRTLTKAGDAVVIQSPTYYCFMQLLETLGLRAIEVPSYPDRGIDMADLRNAVTRFDVAACIFTPNFNNPDGSLMPDAAKKEIVDFLSGCGIPIVEDDVYGDIHFSDRRPGTMKQHDDKGLVLHCSSFSKTLAPGYRAGWLLPGKFREKTLEIKATTNVCCATPTQVAVARYLASGQYERHLRRLRTSVERQMRTMQAAIGRYFPEGTRMTNPPGGTELWLELPERFDSIECFVRAEERGIGICPGAVFSTQDRYNNFMRLSCGTPWTERTENGIRELGKTAAELLA